MRHPKGKGCWYMTYISECPICGSGEVIRERRYSPRPKRDEDRYEYYQYYDYCNAL